MNSPFSKRNVDPKKVINPMAYMPAEQFGRSIDRTPPPTGGGSAFSFPFQINDVSEEMDPKVNVRFGTVEDIAPTDVGTDLAMSDGETNIIYIDCTLDAEGIVTAASLEVDIGSLPADLWDHAYKLIGYVTVTGGEVEEILQSLMFSQGFAPCGRDVDDPETTPGVYYFFVD